VVEVSARALLVEIWPPAVAAVLAALALLPLERWVVQAGERGAAAGLGLLLGEVAVGALLYVAFLAAFAPKTVRELVQAARGPATRPHRGGGASLGER
jgi:hypothetical protein